MLHWLILLPYYFVGALATLPLLILTCRVLRLTVSLNSLVGVAIVLTLAVIIIPLACHWVALDAFSGRALLGVVLLSLLLAAIDRLLCDRLPLPLDRELAAL